MHVEIIFHFNLKLGKGARVYKKKLNSFQFTDEFILSSLKYFNHQNITNPFLKYLELLYCTNQRVLANTIQNREGNKKMSADKIFHIEKRTFLGEGDKRLYYVTPPPVPWDRLIYH